MNRTILATALCALLALLVAPDALAGDVVEIRVRGCKRVEPDAIRVVLQTQVNAPVDPATVARDVRAIFALGFFDDVRVELEPGDKGDSLVFVVTEKPSIASVAFRGNEEVADDKIKEVVDIKPLSVLNISKIQANAQKIKELYVEKGFFLAEVEYELKKQPNNSVSLTFVVNEHAKVEVKRITFIGAEKVGEAELRDIMETREGGFFSFLTSFGTYKEDGLKRDIMRISEYYYNVGYLNVKVSDPVVEISRDRRYLFVTIAIEEGEQYSIGDVDFSGDLMVPDEELVKACGEAIAAGGLGLVLSTELLAEAQEKLNRKKLGDKQFEAQLRQLEIEILREVQAEAKQRIAEGVWEEDQPARKPSKDQLREKVRAELLAQIKIDILKRQLLFSKGEIFSRMKLGMSIFKVRDVYKDRGYAYAEVIPETHIDSTARIIDLNLRVQKGLKVFIERIEIKGNLKTRDKVIRRQLKIYEGEYYSGTGLTKSQRKVNGLGFFEKVDVSEKRGSGPDKIVITFEVKERQTGTFQIGAGFSSVENFIATAQVSQQNLFGRGQTLSLMAQLSSLRQFFSLQFVEPYFLDTNWYLAASVFNTQLDYINFVRKASGGRMTLGYWFLDDWRVSFTYKLENVAVSAGRGTQDGYRAEALEQDGWTSSVQTTLMFDNRDNRLFPTDGYFLQASAEWASPYLASENQFLRLSGIIRWYYPIIWGIVFKTNLSLGYITSLENKPIPIFEKYFVGGIYSVRGFEPRSIGPYSPSMANGFDPSSFTSSTNIGGNKEVIFNVELEFPIFPQVNIRGVVFLDAGNAFGEDQAIFEDRYSADGKKETFGGLYWATGFGFRWISPIGPLRFEWGIPITRRPGDKDILFEFTIGNFF